MGKLNKIKLMLQSMLLEFKNLSTDNGLLQYDEDEIAEGIQVWKVNEAGERIKAEDGTYTTEDGTEYVVSDNRIASIKEVVRMEEQEPQPQVTEEQVEPTVEEQETVTEPQELVTVQEPDKSEDEKKVSDERFNDLSTRLAAIEKKIEELSMSFSKFSQEPAQKPVTEEIRTITSAPTGNEGLDRLRKMMGK